MSEQSPNESTATVAVVSGSDQAGKPSCQNWEDHKWKETYYGDECENCGLFFAHGCAPWDDDGLGENHPCDICGGTFSHQGDCPDYFGDDDPPDCI